MADFSASAGRGRSVKPQGSAVSLLLPSSVGSSRGRSRKLLGEWLSRPLDTHDLKVVMPP